MHIYPHLRKAQAASLLGLSLLIFTPQSAHAIPSYARQTGFACEACHTVFPELTPFGRRFKLYGYTMTTKESVSDIDSKKNSTLSLSNIPPLSAMVMASTTFWNNSQPDSNVSSNRAQNGNVQFPQQLSLFYGGKIADNLGAFAQITYSQASGSFGIDNSDIRYADHTADNKWVWGATLNNNPTVQDAWNSTPAWGYPYFTPAGGFGGASSPVLAAPLISSLAGNVAGLGGYGFYDDKYYFELTGYRTAAQGISGPVDSKTVAATTASPAGSGIGVIEEVSPYWRAAYERQMDKHVLEVGTFGLFSRYQPGGAANLLNRHTASTYWDTGLDSQYQYIGENHIFSVLASYIHEGVDRPTSEVGTAFSSPHDYLNKTSITGSYFYNRKWGGSLSLNEVSGKADPLLYPAGTVVGAAKGSPDSQWETLEFDYLPWLNTKVQMQYTIYNRVNGGDNHYDTATTNGRNASDNNTFMLGLWTTF